MAVNLGSAYGKVTLDANGVSQGVASARMNILQLSDAGIQLGQSMRNVGAALTLALTVPLALVGKNAIKAASDLNESKNKVKVVFGEMSDAVLEWSKTSAKAMGESQQQALEAAGS